MTTARKLNAETQEVMKEIALTCFGDDAERLLRRPPETWLSAQVKRLRDEAGKDLAAQFDSNGEPNARGLQLEEIIGFLNLASSGPRAR